DMILNLLEKMIGRDLLWRISRRVYLHARREGSLDFAVNGEAWLQRQFARRSRASGAALTIIDVGANYGQWSSAMIKALREARTLDDYWAGRGGGPIDLVKIDAEGYDPSVIAGMRGLMAAGSVDVIQFEYGELFRRTRTFLRDMIEIAHRHGYRYGNLHRNGIELLDQWHFDMESFFGSNKLLIHPRALEWLPAKPMTYSPRNTLVSA
ncbi:MAG: FkbM family methyltransferase, partial [Sphingomicrobium sp.]